MKTSFFLTVFFLISLSAFILYSKFEENSDNISVSIKDTDDTYRLNASFNRGNSTRVLQYINSSIGGDSYFEPTSRRIDVTTRLHDNTEFYIKESSGRLKIELDKRKNSTASYYRIKKMCEGLKGILAGSLGH